MHIFSQQLNNLLHVQLSWLVPFGTDKNWLACMDCFSQGSMQKNPLFQGSIFSSCRLHARISSETSHQVLLSLDLWHAHHNLDVIKTYQPNDTKLIPHINLVALTSHITSRSCRHIQLNSFGVSLLSMTCVAFMLLIVFSIVWVLVSSFLWMLYVVYMYVSLS